MDDIQKLSDQIQKQLEKLENETLEQIYRDHTKAVEYIKKQVASQNLDKQAIDNTAYEMQIVAKMLLKERSNN